MGDMKGFWDAVLGTPVQEDASCERCDGDGERDEADPWCHDCWYEVHVLGWGVNYESVPQDPHARKA